MLGQIGENLVGKIRDPVQTIKTIADTLEFVVGGKTSEQDGVRVVELTGDVADSGLADLLTGAPGLIDLSRGDVRLDNLADAAGVAIDAGIPGPPIMPMIAGLGLADSIPRLAGKLDLSSVGEIADQAKEMIHGLVRGQTIESEDIINIGGQAVQKRSGLFPNPGQDTVRQVANLESDPGRYFPDGISVVSSRMMDTADNLKIAGVHGSAGDVGREFENTLGTSKVRRTLRELEPEFPGAERASFNRVGGVARNQPEVPQTADEFRNMMRADEDVFVGAKRELDVSRTGERSLQKTGVLNDFLTTVLANNPLSGALEGADELTSDLFEFLLNLPTR